MKRRSTYAMLALALGAAVMAGPVMAKEQLLGTAIYEALPQRDVVNVGAAEGRPRQPHEVWSDGASAYLPWLWDRRRLENFAGVNAVVAAGILTGYLAWV